MSQSSFTRPIIFGEVLFDRFPGGGEVLGGAPFNVAWNLRALGLSPLLVSRVGDDELGQRILEAMTAWDMDPAAMKIDPDHPTGTVDISLENGEPTFTIAEDQAYDHLDLADLPPLAEGALVYHGSLALRAPASRDAWINWAAHQRADLFMDVNLRAPFWDRAVVVAQARQASWAKLNKDELCMLIPGSGDTADKARVFMAGSGLQALVVTRGERGVSLFTPGDGELRPTPVPAARVQDTVGAGDAFSSVVILGLARDWDWSLILQRAQAFAAAVVGLQGATTHQPEFYQTFKNDWELT